MLKQLRTSLLHPNIYHLSSISNDGSTTRTQSGMGNLSCRDSSDFCRCIKSLWQEIRLDYGINLWSGLDRMNVMLASVMYWVVWHNVLRWRRNVCRMVVNRPNDQEAQRNKNEPPDRVMTVASYRQDKWWHLIWVQSVYCASSNDTSGRLFHFFDFVLWCMWEDICCVWWIKNLIYFYTTRFISERETFFILNKKLFWFRVGVRFLSENDFQSL